MKIRDLMTKHVASVRATDSTAVAARMMWDCDCGAIPVLDDDGCVIAMITDRDICMSALMRDRAPSAIPVSEAMSRDLQFCGPDDNLSTAEQIMRAHQIRRLPVVDRERRPLGVLSLADIACATDHHKGRGARPVGAEEVAVTLAEICTTPARDANPSTRASF
ncbi:MAG TPA: CBS domain-containing protein [Polyangia bacterium]|nr:CBS domain-containing protein [Polyangia bacterium]